jgi:menaquinone-specific isochorismate synthase
MARVTTVAVDHFEDLLARLPAAEPLAWVRQGQGVVGWGEAARIPVGAGTGRFERANAGFAQWCEAAEIDDSVGVPGTGPIAVASFAFDRASPDSVMIVPAVVLGRDGDRSWMTVVDGVPGGSPPARQALPPPTRVRYAGASVSEITWLEAVDRAARTVRDGTLDKVVLARDLKVWSDEVLDVRVLARRLAERFDDCWTFICDGLVGATPELLVRRTEAAATSMVLAGSAPRGLTPHDDERMGAALQDSAKDRREHEVAVASVLDRLGAVADDVTADAHPWLLRLANVQHLATTVTATLPKEQTALQLAGLLHPTAAVCGTPTQPALEHIRSAEGMERGRYSGPVGWMDASGNGEFGIALRCAEVAGTRGRLFAGAGIMGESLPESELEETRLKLRAMQSALEGVTP